LPVGILNPHAKLATELVKVASFHKAIRVGVLKVAQFPDQLTDAQGTITKPASW
jgi:hypothetical protein